MRKTVRRCVHAVMTAAVVMLLSTCNDSIVGLGSAIDVTPPTMTIDGPSTTIKALKGAFLLHGSISDDRGIKSITVTVQETSGGAYGQAKSFNVPAKNIQHISSQKYEWSIMLNTPQDNKFPLPDGTYTATVLGADFADKTVKQETVFTIDNTPPLFVVTRPSTMGMVTGDLYGDELWLEGLTADTAGVKELLFTAYTQDGTIQKTLKLTENIPPTVRLKLDSFKDSKGTPSIYRNIYGEKFDGDKQFFCAIELRDGAAVYTEKNNVKMEGNYTDTYYLYAPLVNNIVFPKYTIDELYQMHAGLAPFNTRMNEQRSAEIKATIQPILDGLKNGSFEGFNESFKIKKPSTSSVWEDTKKILGSFTLNPLIDPHFEVIGYEPSDRTADIAQWKAVTVGSPISIKISPNTDNIPLEKKFTFYAIEADSFESYRDKYRKGEAIENIEGVIKLDASSVNAQGSSYLAIVPMDKEKLKVGKSYIFKVLGSDKQNNKLQPFSKNSKGYAVPNAEYCFTIFGVGKPPELKVTAIGGVSGTDTIEASDPDASNVTKLVYVKKGDSLVFDAYLGGEEFPIDVTYTLVDDSGMAIRDTGGNIVSVKERVERTTAVGTVLQRCKIDAGKIPQNMSANYGLKVEAVSVLSKHKTERSYQIYYDVEEPRLTVNIPDGSLYTEMPEVTGSVLDVGIGADLDSLKAVYWYNDQAEQEWPFKTKAGSWALKPLAAPKEGVYKIQITAADKLGLSSQRIFTFKYDKAAPRITRINSTAVNGSTVPELFLPMKDVSLTVTFVETNKIQSVKYGRKDKELTPVNFSSQPDSSGIYMVHLLTKDLPDNQKITEDGEYIITLELKDAFDRTASLDIPILVDTEAPAFKSMAIAGKEFETFEAPSSVVTASSTVSIKGAFVDKGSGIEKVVAQYKESSSDAQDKKVEFSPRFTGNGIYTIDGSIPLPLKTTTVTITVYDKVYDTVSDEEKDKHKKQWTSDITVENSALALILGMKAEIPQYPKDGAIHVKTPFDITAEGVYSGSAQLPLELMVTKDGAAADLTGFYTSTTIGDSQSATGITLDSSGTTVTPPKDKITGFKSGSKAIPAEKYTVRFTPRNTETAPHKDDGRYVFTLKSDSVQKDYVVLVDTQGPGIIPIYPQESGVPFFPGKEVKASFFDASGITAAKVHYKYNGGGEKSVTLSPPAYEVKIAVDSGQTSVAGQMSEIKEGKYEIWFTAEDNLGQKSESTHAIVYYDKKPPQLTGVTVNGAETNTVYVKKGTSSFNITATAKDDNGIKDVRVYAGNDTIANMAKDTGDSWTVSFDVPETGIFSAKDQQETVATLTDGSYGIKIKAKDNAGAESEVFRTLVIDRVEPTFNVTQLGSQPITHNQFNWFTTNFIPDGELKIVYTTSDSGSGIDYVEYVFTKNTSGTVETITTKRFEKHFGTMSIHVPAEAAALILTCADKAGNKTVHTVTLKVDSADPVISSITNIGTYNYAPAVIVGKEALKITGTVTETGSGIDKITWSLAGNKGEGNITGNKWELNLTKEQVKEGTLSITAIDKVGKKSPEKTVVFLQDKEAPEAKITNFAPEASQTGKITVKGSIKDDGTAGVDSGATKWMVVKKTVTDITPQTTGWKDMSKSNVATWEIEDFKLTDYVTAAPPYESEYATARTDGSGFFDLPLYILVKDTVGNAKVEKLTILVDPAGNKPVVTIVAPISPKNDDTTKAMSVGGKVSVYGSANVKIGQVAEVYMQVSKDKTFQNTADFVPGWENKKIDGTSNWNTVLNSTGEIDALMTTGNVNHVIVYYRLYAKNTASQSNAQGNYTEVQMLKFDKDNPIIENALLHKSASDTTGSTYQTRSWVTKDDAYLTVNFRDDSGIKNISLSGAITATLEGHAAISAYEIDGAKVFTAVGGAVSNGNYNYTAKIPIKTTSLAGTNGEYSITIEITEGTSTGSNVHRQWANYTFRYDNTKPIGFFGKRITEGSYNFSGKNVPDNIPQEELKADRFLFVNGKKITINTKTPSGFELSEEVNGSHDWVLFKDARYLNGASAVLSGVAYDEGGSGIKKITGQITKGSQTKTFTVEGSDKIISRIGNFVTWEATVDVSSEADDGEYALTYKVVDGVGNELNVDSSAGEKVYVKNNMLHITKVYLGTDLNMSNAVEEGKEEVEFLETETKQNNHTLDYTGKIKASSFTFKRKEYSHIRLEYTGGNNTINYVLKKGDVEVASGVLQTNKTIPLDAAAFNKIGDGEVNLTLALTDTCGWSSTEAITVNVNANDTIHPYAAILPFFWNENKDGKSSIVWEEDGASTSTQKPRIPKGHISHEGKRTSTDGSATVTYSGTPAVSGKVKIQGYAYDERLLTNIKVKAGTLTAEASFNKASGNAWTPGGSDSTGLTLSVEHVRLDQSGHYVKWTAVWDSEKVSVSEDVTLEVLADDTVTVNTGSPLPNPLNMKSKVKKISGEGTRSGETKIELAADDTAVTAGQTVKLYSDELSKHYGAYYAQIDSKEGKVLTLSSSVPLEALKYEVYTNTEDNGASPLHTTKVDVVPYITKISTDLSKLGGNEPDLYARTALGRYPVREGETITIHGFNLQGATYKIGSVTVGTVSGAAPKWTLPITSGSSGASSGKLEVKVSSIEAINNRNDNSKPYNKGAKTANNDTLIDDVELDIWQFNDKAVQPSNGHISDAVMKINPVEGFLGFAFANGADLFSMPSSDKSYIKRQRNWDDYGSIGLAYGSGGTAHAVAAARDTNLNNYFNSETNDVAGPFTYFSTQITAAGATDANEGYSGSGGKRLESLGVVFTDAPEVTVGGKTKKSPTINKHRIQSPSFAVSKNSVYLAYYDEITDQIRFRHKGQLNNAVNGRPTAPDAPAADHSLIAGGATGNTSGRFVSIAVKSGNTQDGDVVVAVWYTGSNLVYAYKTKPANDTDASSSASATPLAGNWSKPVTIFENAGEYCQIAVDKDGGIHIAAYHGTNAALLYAFMSSHTEAAKVQKCTVDSYGIVGTNITLDVAYTAADGKPVPYIGYYADFAVRPKLAYLVIPETGFSHAPEGADENGKMSGKWEISFVPTKNRTFSNRINVGVWKDNSGIIKNSVTGTSSSDTSEGKVYGNGTKNPVLAYVIRNGKIETAQKK